MTYLRILRLLGRITGRLRKHADPDKAWWSWVAYYDGQIAFRQLNYAERVQKASGWEPVEVVTPPRIAWSFSPPTTTTTAGSVTYTYSGKA